MLKSIQARTLAAMLCAVLITAALSEWLSYRSARQILAQEASRTLHVTADAKKHELLLNLKRQQDRALAFLENNLIDCLEVRDVRCVRINLANFAAGEEATGALARLHGGKSITIGDAQDLANADEKVPIRFETGMHRYVVIARSAEANADIMLRFPSTLIEPVFTGDRALDGESAVLVVDDRGQIFAGNDRSDEPALNPDSKAMQGCLAGRNGEETVKDARGTKVVTSYVHLAEMGGGCVMARMDEATMLLPAKRLRYEMAGISVILVLIAIAASFYLNQRISRPLKLLTERARRLQRGDFDSTIPIHGPTEIATFAETFAAMVASLKRSREQERLAQQKLMQSEKLAAAGKLAATVAHEVNNPLAGAMNALFLLRDKVTDAGRSLLETSEEQLKRVAGITRQTLGFYRENSSKSEFDVAEIVTDLVATFTPRARNKDIVIESEVGVVPIVAVKGEIQQVIANLLTNAIDASAPHSKIRIRARRFESSNYGDAVQFSIGDSGPGIPAHLRQKIWEPFFTTKEGTGTGLGLWVCKQIVERHKGSIRERSTKNGSVFTVVLPQVTAKGAKKIAS